jgi:serine/threonine-protein kinase
MGVVYRATDLTLHRSVAIKTLPRVSPERAVRLRREARAMAAITHPHLALIFGAESWRGTPMLVFELLDGGTLADRLHGGPLPATEVLALGIAMAGVLEKLHAAGVLHRDIKPSNIGFTADGIPKLLDFGLARLLNQPVAAGRDLTQVTATVEPAITSDWLPRSHRLVGTIPYLSPEAVRSEPPDPSVDLWSLSVVLFEALTGKNPFARTGVFETIAAIAGGRIPSLGEALPGSAPALAAFFRDALSPDLETRPSSARALRQQLEALHEELVRRHENSVPVS